MKVYLTSSCSCINKQFNLLKENRNIIDKNRNNIDKSRTDLRNPKKESNPEGMEWGLSR